MYWTIASAADSAVISFETSRNTCFVKWFTITYMCPLPCRSRGDIAKPSIPIVDLGPETFRCRVIGAILALSKTLRYFWHTPQSRT